MIEKLNKIKSEYEADAKILSSAEIKNKYLGKNSELMQILSSIKDLSPDEKKIVGKEGNALKRSIESQINSEGSDSKSSLSSEDIDVTLPGKRLKLGRLHPHTLVMREMNDIFRQLGFSVYSGPEIETDEYIFEKANLPKNHPARSLQDTLTIKDPEILLRSHTSSVENRAMENEKLPLRIVVPGRVYRYEDLNQTNHFAFFQYQGVCVGEDITMADLKGTFEFFVHQFFGSEVQTRFRSKYYPEVEPGVGLDLMCKFCGGTGCPVCKRRGWAEILGAGMIHPNMLRMSGIDPKKYSGFAWGMGFDRLVMQKYGISDIRVLFNGGILKN